jgi:lysophospholipid acyltransferase
MIGAFFLAFFGKEWFLFVNLITTVNFLIGKIIPKKSFIPISIFSFASLLYVHYYRYIVERYLLILKNSDTNWRIDFNVIQMMLTCRYIYFASELEDG